MAVIKVPDELTHEIDRLAGAGKRPAFAVDVFWREVRCNGQRDGQIYPIGPKRLCCR